MRTVVSDPADQGTVRTADPTRAVHDALVEVVSEKTGYPPEMLEPGMQLDADLGIDSIKRVEILAALQERLPEAPVIGPEHLGTIRTLGQIVEFLAGNNKADAPSLAVVDDLAGHSEPRPSFAQGEGPGVRAGIARGTARRLASRSLDRRRPLHSPALSAEGREAQLREPALASPSDA